MSDSAARWWEAPGAVEPRSKHFRLGEWSKSPELSATPYPQGLVHRWYALAETLDIIREAVGRPIELTPNGGYRNEVHNRERNGKRASRHMFGDAADIRARGWSAKRLHALILRMYNEGKLPQLGGLGLYSWGVHVDTRPKAPGAKLARWGGAASGQIA